VRADVPRQLPRIFYDDARRLRNQLLTWRMENYWNIETDEKPLLDLESARLVQIALPIYSVSDTDFRNTFLAHLKNTSRERAGSGPQAVVVATLLGTYGTDPSTSRKFFPGDVLKAMRGSAHDLGLNLEEYSAHRIGDILKSLGFEPQKRTNRGYPYSIVKAKLDELAAAMGMEHTPAPTSATVEDKSKAEATK
jgi:hypothetical protein